MLVMADIVEHRFAVACTFQGGQHLIYVITRFDYSAGWQGSLFISKPTI